MARYGMLIDLSLCVGCNACTIACKVSNVTPKGVFFTHVDKVETGKFPNTQSIFFPRACMQCADAPCVTVCPTNATYKRSDGIVMVDQDKCIGCRYCVAACPYGARTYLKQIQSYFESDEGTSQFEQDGYAQYQVGTVAKCEFCAKRVDQSYLPACVQTCPAVARHFGDLDDPNSEISQLIKSSNAVQLLPELGTNPSVYYVLPKQQVTLVKR